METKHLNKFNLWVFSREFFKYGINVSNQMRAWLYPFLKNPEYKYMKQLKLAHTIPLYNTNTESDEYCFLTSAVEESSTTPRYDVELFDHVDDGYESLRYLMAVSDSYFSWFDTLMEKRIEWAMNVAYLNDIDHYNDEQFGKMLDKITPYKQFYEPDDY